jgi:hypothetical protein
MKILDLRKKNITSFSISGALFFILALGIFYNFYKKSSLEAKISKINSEASQIKNETAELESKAIELKKYRLLWNNLTDGKKSTNGIKMDEINAKLTSIAEKYTIISPLIKVTLPETLNGGLFDRSKINVLSTTVNLNFRAIDDVKALSFIVEFIESLPGYPVITNLQIKKDKSYTNDDLIALSSGKGGGAVSGKVDFFWYAFKNKETENKKESDNKLNSKVLNE